MTPEPPAGTGILMRCPRGHEQRLFTPDHTLEEATWLAGLLDGTSPAFVTSPRDCLAQGGLIGRCATCGELFTCTLFGYRDPSR